MRVAEQLLTAVVARPPTFDFAVPPSADAVDEDLEDAREEVADLFAQSAAWLHRARS